MKHWVISVCGVATLALSACGGSSDDTKDGSKAKASVGAPSSGASVGAPAVNNNNAMAGRTGGAAGASTPVMTAGGASGSGGASSMVMTPMGSGGATSMVKDPPKIVTVDPADVASCNPVGAPPSDDEEVEVLQIRTSDPDVVSGGFMAPGGTYYGCFWKEIDMPEKHHIIGWEGAVGDRAVHHQQVSLSKRPVYVATQGQLCGLPSVDFTWTGEKPTEWTPKLAGYPIGGAENGGKAYFLWQVHFESATQYMGGFNAYITKNLRKYDAGNFEQGDVAGISIPAMATAHHEADCTPEMTTQKLTYPIYIFAAMQHAHLTVTHIKSELSRDGAVIKLFGDQEVSGFLGFFDQQFAPVMPCQEFHAGDSMKTTCDYKNNGAVEITGGEGLNQEMCTTFYQYFPRLPGTSNNFCGTIDATGGLTM